MQPSPDARAGWRPSGVVSLLTDFGLSDAYVGIMKGAVLRADRRAQIIDLCHEVPAQDVEVGAFFVGGGGSAALADPATQSVVRLLPLAALAAVPFLMLRPVFEALHRPRLGVLISVVRFVALSWPCVLGGRYLAERSGGAPLFGVVGGLITATLLTLFVLPALYQMLEEEGSDPSY